MTDEEIIRKTAAINYEIIITHGLMDGGVGFEWQGIFIHDPFVDPQYGAFPVDPVEQYGDAYLKSIFATEPAKGLQMARQQLRAKAREDLCRYVEDKRVRHGIITTIGFVCGVKVLQPDDPFCTLTDQEVAQVWALIDGIT